MADEFNVGTVLPKSLQEEMRTSYMEYAMSVIVARALPSALDGLKPVQRRILYAMQQEGATAGSRYRKCAAFVGEVMKTFHPHGDVAIYDALVRMAQPFSLRYPLVDGQGNFGSVDGDPAAAMRYCAAGETLISTPGGTYRLEELARGMSPDTDRDAEFEVLGRDGRPVRVSKIFHSGSHPTLRLKTREGFELTGTHNHPVLCLVDVLGVPMLLWKLLEEIRPGDHVVLARDRVHSDVASDDDIRWGLLAGALVSEGWVSERRAGFNNVDPAFFGAVLDCYDQVVGGRRDASVRTLPSGRVLYELDIQDKAALSSPRLAELRGRRSAAKDIPASIWKASSAVKRVFLQALFTGDGSSSTLPRSSIQVSYSTRSPQLARDVQQMLLEFGIVSRLCASPSGEIKAVIGNRRDARLFCEQIGFLGSKHIKLCEAVESLPSRSRSLGADRIPVLASYIRVESGSRGTDSDWLRRNNIDRVERWERDAEEIYRRIASPETRAVVEPLVKAGYYYAAVESVEPAGVQPVYSLKVETDEHAFITNGFISHNTEARMSAITAEMLADIEKDTVDFIPNYNAEDEEPTVLPARIPNLLINGSSGIAVGMTTNIPPHNIKEVAAGVNFLIDNPDATSEDLMGYISGPDFPTGGIIKGISGIKQAYATGHGRIIIRARHRFEEGANGRQRIIIEELPYQVNKANLVSKIAELVSDRKLEGIADLNDESDRHGMRIVVELKREARPYTVLNNLYKHTQLQQTFGCIMLALVDGRPEVLGLKKMLQVFIDHRRNVIIRRTRFDLAKAQERAHILEGLKIALDHLDDVIATIRASKDPATASTQLQEKFGLSERQAQAILDLRLQRLTQLERTKIDEEYEEVIKLIAYLESVLASEQKVRMLIQEEMTELTKKYGDDRRTEIDFAEATELSAEDLIPKEEVVLTLTHRGYAKRQASRTFRAQRRGGVGLKGARPTAGGEAPTGEREEDYAEHLLITHTHAQLLFFTQSGRVFQLHVYEIPERERQAKGTPINNLIELGAGERVTAVFVRPEEEDEARYMLMVTRRGQIKKTAMREYANVRRNGLIAINLQQGDELEYVRPTSGDDEILIASEKGKAIRFHESEVRPMGRDTMGVRGMRLGADDLVAGMVVAKPGTELLVVSQRGFGKRTPIEEYPTHHRAGQGVYTLQVTDKVGRLAAIRAVENVEEEEILLITASGMVLRTVVEAIRRSSRQTQGVIVMRLQPEDQVVGLAPVGMEEE